MDVNAHRHDAAERQPAAPLTTVSAQKAIPQQPAITAECGSGWYHDVAIKESQQAPARKH